MKKYRYRKNIHTSNLYRIQKKDNFWGYWETQFHVNSKEEAIECVKTLNNGGSILVGGVKIL